MSYADTGTSVRRNLPFLTPAEQALFLPSEAELRAIDRHTAIAKASGLWDRLNDAQALRDQIRFDSLTGGRR